MNKAIDLLSLLEAKEVKTHITVDLQPGKKKVYIDATVPTGFTDADFYIGDLEEVQNKIRDMETDVLDVLQGLKFTYVTSKKMRFSFSKYSQQLSGHFGILVEFKTPEDAETGANLLKRSKLHLFQ